MTEKLYRSDPYAQTAPGVVQAHTDEGGIILDQTIFYPRGGGQPGDSGALRWDGGALKIASTLMGQGDEAILVPAEPRELPKVGQCVTQVLDWERRYNHMRIHSALHLLSVVLPYGVTGGAITAEKGRLDFNMPQMPDDVNALENALAELIAKDAPISESWITEAELDAQPHLVKTMSVAPPRNAGAIRLVRIGNGSDPIDLQPCGGTHVARTGEIGAIKISKIENKGRTNKRVHLVFGMHDPS